MDGLPALTIALVFVASIILGSGVVAASGNALPGDTLYPVKLSVENVQLAAAFGDEAKAQFALRQAAGRLAEIDRANEIGRTDAITTAATGYVQFVADANQHLADAAASGQDIHVSASKLNGELARQSKDLALAEGRVPASARSSVAAAERAAQSGIDVNGNSSGRTTAGRSGTVPETTTPTPTIRPNSTPGPSSTAARSPEVEATNVAEQTGTEIQRPPRENATPRPSLEPAETTIAAASGRPGSDGSNDDNRLAPTGDSSTPVPATRVARPNRDAEATSTPRPTGAEESTDNRRVTRTRTPTESEHGRPRSDRTAQTPTATPRSDSSGGDQGGGGD